MPLALARIVLAALSGVVVYAAYEPIGWWIAGILGLSGLYLALAPWPAQGRRVSHQPGIRLGLALAFIHSIVLYALTLPWLATFIGLPPYVALVIACSIYALLLGGIGVLVARWRFGWVAFAFLYVAVEFLRSHWPFGGASWVRLAWGQVNGPLANIIPLGGAASVSLATVLVGAALAAALLGQRRAVLAAITIIAVAAVGQIGINRSGYTSGVVDVAAVQGNIPHMEASVNTQRGEVINNHLRLTEELASRGVQPDLVIWPENSAPVNLENSSRLEARVQEVTNAINAPLMVGTIRFDEAGARNSMVVYSPGQGVTDMHHKKYLVPFGEYMPLRKYLEDFIPMAEMIGNYQPGDGDGVVMMGDTAVGVATCYEIAFDEAIHTPVLAGAQILTTPTNNSDFNFTDMTYQQLAMSRMRAMEADRAVVVSATTGVSAIVHPDGSVSKDTDLFVADTLTESLPLRTSITPAVRFGHWIELAIVMIGSVIAVIAVLSHIKGKGRKKK